MPGVRLLRVMRHSEFWKPLIISLVATPICLFLGMASAGAGHGSYFLAKALFPYTMLSTIFFESITAPFILLAVIQIPFYGVILGAANAKDKYLPLAKAFLVAHILAVAACFLFVGESFS
jgi:hypothetical protein